MRVPIDVIRANSRKRAISMLCVLTVGLSVTILYIFWAGSVRDSWFENVEKSLGERLGFLGPISLVAPCFPFFLVPVVVGERLTRRFELACPECQKKLTLLVQYVTTTGCCTCGYQIIEDIEPVSRRAYDRWNEKRSLYFLDFFLYTWPLLSLTGTIKNLFGSQENLPQSAVLGTGLVGLVSSTLFIWKYGKRYRLQFGLSVLVFLFGAFCFYKTWP